VPIDRLTSPLGAALIAYTSGSSGAPKGVVIGEDALRFILDTNARLNEWRDGDVFLAALPLSHVAGFANLATALRDGVTLVASPGFVFAKSVVKACARHHVTVTGLVPHYLTRMLAQPDFDTLALRLIVLSAAPIVPSDVEQAQKCLPRLQVANAYGLTEAFRSIVLAPRYVPAALPALGHQTAGVRVELRDETGAALPLREGTRGIAWIHGPNVMLGYWNRPQETAERIRDGWFNTLDYLACGPNGAFHFAGRADFMINAGGEKRSCESIEECVARAPGVLEAAVVGVERSSAPPEIVAFIVTDGTATVTLEHVRQACAVVLHSAFLPTRLVTVPSLSRTSTGKLERGALAQIVRDGQA
jgi:acyl-CoA synthetase (AMP-forming)/AMP-acid ligase II